MCAFVLVDPIFCGGEHSRSWRSLEPELAKLYPYMALAFPKRRCEMAALVSAALRDGHTEIVAVGSGTLDETVNGFFNPEGSLSPDAVLAVIPSSGGGVLRLGKAIVRPVDVGRVRYLSNSGKPRTRYFAIRAMMGGERMAGRPFDLLSGLLGFPRWTVRLKIDQTFDEIVPIRSVAINNGPVFGPKRFAADTQPDDGEFDVAIRTGPCGAVTHVRGRKITAAPVEQTHGRPVSISLDGQAVGRLPATFEILPRALNVRC